MAGLRTIPSLCTTSCFNGRFAIRRSLFDHSRDGEVLGDYVRDIVDAYQLGHEYRAYREALELIMLDIDRSEDGRRVRTRFRYMFFQHWGCEQSVKSLMAVIQEDAQAKKPLWKSEERKSAIEAIREMYRYHGLLIVTFRLSAMALAYLSWKLANHFWLGEPPSQRPTATPAPGRGDQDIEQVSASTEEMPQ